MRQTFKIRDKLTGSLFDLDNSATVEINLGGISLLSLSGRSGTFSNSFSLPRTFANETLLSYSASPARLANPKRSVTIEAGLFERSGLLTVLSFDKDYKVSINYDDENVLNAIKETNFYSLVFDLILNTLPGESSEFDVVQKMCEPSTFTDGIFYPVSYPHIIPYTDAIAHMSCAIPVLHFLSVLGTTAGATFTGDVLTDPDFLNLCIFNKNAWMGYYYDVDTDTTIIEQRFKPVGDDLLSCGNILKALSQILLFDVIPRAGGVIELKKITGLSYIAPVDVEGFTWVKNFVSGYSKNNYINYKKDSTYPKTQFSDNLIAEGEGDKELFEINSFVPIYYVGAVEGYDYGSVDNRNNLMIASLALGSYNVFFSTGVTHLVNAYLAAPLSLSGFYSGEFNSLFVNPVILDATCNFSPLIFSELSESRVLRSIQLSGKYWIDSMAYNLGTGDAKLKLIKL